MKFRRIVLLTLMYHIVMKEGESVRQSDVIKRGNRRIVAEWRC